VTNGGRKRKTGFISLLALLAFFLLAGSLAAYMLFFSFTPAEREGKEVVVQIPGGANLLSASNLLNRSGVLRSVRPFVFLAKFTGRAHRIQAGELLFRTDMTPLEVMDVLTRGKAVTYNVTIPEGFNIYQVASVLADKGLGDRDRFLTLARDAGFCRSLEVPADTLEGFLFPDTYSWPKGLPEKEILGQMVARFRKVYTPEMEERARELGMTRLEVVTLASLVEKETGVSEERELVSSVFHNRLRKGYLLQTDPSVIYGIEDFDGNLTRKHLQMDHPYNTYLRRGLPPGPVANPGRASLLAALYPADTSFLYFVAKGDGTHVFSTNLAEHNEAVRRYQLGGGR